jgi:DNA-binding MarR family transcriptional regulator
MSRFDLNESVGYLLASVHWRLKNQFSAIIATEGFRVTPEQWAVLIVAHRSPGVSQTELAQLCLKDKTNVTRILDVLERDGLLIRADDARDRRVYRIRLTAAGEKMVQRLIPLAKRANAAACRRLDATDVRALKALLKRLAANLDTVEK